MTGRFRFHLDENVPPQIAPALRAIWKRHWFTTTNGERLPGTKDLSLFPVLSEREHHAIITFDRNQLGDDMDREERNALVAAGLHWIGIPMAPERTRGAQMIARATAILVSSLPFVLEDWRQQPHAYHLREPRIIDAMVPEVERL